MLELHSVQQCMGARSAVGLMLPQLTTARAAAQRCRGALRRWQKCDAMLAAGAAAAAAAAAGGGGSNDSDSGGGGGGDNIDDGHHYIDAGAGAGELAAVRLYELASAAEEMVAELMPAVAALSRPTMAPGGGLAFPLRNPCSPPATGAAFAPAAPSDALIEFFVQDGGVGMRLVAVAECAEPAAQEGTGEGLDGTVAAVARATVSPNFLEGEGAGSFMLGHIASATAACADHGAGGRTAGAALAHALGSGSMVSRGLLRRLGVQTAAAASTGIAAATTPRLDTMVSEGQVVNCEGRWLLICHVDVAWAKIPALTTAQHALQGAVAELSQVRERCLAISTRLSASERASVGASAVQPVTQELSQVERAALALKAEELLRQRESALAARQLARQQEQQRRLGKEEQQKERERAAQTAAASASHEAGARAGRPPQRNIPAPVPPVQSSVPSSRPKDVNVKAPGGSIFDDFDVPKPKPAAAPAATADPFQSSIFDDF